MQYKNNVPNPPEYMSKQAPKQVLTWLPQQLNYPYAFFVAVGHTKAKFQPVKTNLLNLAYMGLVQECKNKRINVNLHCDFDHP